MNAVGMCRSADFTHALTRSCLLKGRDTRRASSLLHGKQKGPLSSRFLKKQKQPSTPALLRTRSLTERLRRFYCQWEKEEQRKRPGQLWGGKSCSCSLVKRERIRMRKENGDVDLSNLVAPDGAINPATTVSVYCGLPVKGTSSQAVNQFYIRAQGTVKTSVLQPWSSNSEKLPNASVQVD